jgi:CRISPR-associated exonuclease Cas4
MLLAACALIILAILLLWVSSRQRRNLGLPTGQVIYSDTGKWREVQQPLFDLKTGLAGKPDYLVQHKGTFIPVEVKSNLKGDQPYQSHVYQLAAYCYLIQQNYNNRPTHGILHYPNRTFAIDYTKELESKLHQIIFRIHNIGNGRAPHRSHESAAKCNHCGYREICDQRIE